MYVHDFVYFTEFTGTEFWSSSKTLQMLRESGCFDSKDSKESFSWPENFQPFVNDGLCFDELKDCDNVFLPLPPADDPLGLSADSDYELAVSALGACVWYLKRCFIHRGLLSMKSFQVSRFCHRDHLLLKLILSL